MEEGQAISVESPVQLEKVLGETASTGKPYEVLLASGEHTAKIYLDGQSVAWAIASGQRDGFQSVLLEEGICSRDDIVRAIHQSRNIGKKSLNEILLSVGVNDELHRHEIIRRHTVSALEAIKHWPQCQVRIQELPAEALTGETALSYNDAFSSWVGKPSRAPQPSAEQQTAEGAVPQFTPTPDLSQPVMLPPAMNEIESLLKGLHSEIPELLSAMIFDGDTGLPIAFSGGGDAENVDAASAFGNATINSALQAAQALDTGSPSSHVDEMIVATDKQFMLVRSLPGGHSYLFMSLNRDANPGLARVVARRYRDRLIEALS